MNDNTVLFSVETPSGFSVSVDNQRWRLIVAQKHPVLTGQEVLVKDMLMNPDQIRKSKLDGSVYLFYRLVKEKRWICAVVKHQNSSGSFLITAYPTDAVKEGEVIWIK